MKIVAVTSCPTGIAHTYMAAEALEEAARARGIELAVETQGAAGSTPVDDATIAEADAVIFAADVPVRGRERFADKPVVEVTVKHAIHNAAALIDQATASVGVGAPADSASATMTTSDGTTTAGVVTASGATAAAGASGSGGAAGAGRSGGGGAATGPATKVPGGAGFGTHLRQWLMTGVSYMIPFVAAGGILIAISFVWGGAAVANKVNGGTFEGITYPEVTDLSKIVDAAGYAGMMYKIGVVAFSMLVPILAGFIAYAMADRPGLVPGIVAGLLANEIGAGFLGGLVGGLMAGALVMLIVKVKVPRSLAGIMPVIVVPLISTFVVGAAMIVVIGQPIARATVALTDWLNGLGGANAVALGLLLGAMMAIDMGGPINKVAYTFALAGLTTGNQTVMAAVMAAGMTPPLALALASVVRPSLFTETERRAGEPAWLLGASFVTEGAIPFAAADPVRVIPAITIGSAVTGAMSMGFDVTSPAPHGGIWVIGLIGSPLMWLLAIVTGAVVSAVCVVFAKSVVRAPDETVPGDERIIDLDAAAASEPGRTTVVKADAEVRTPH